MTLTLLRAADRRAAPWKNGGGVTREVAVRPESDGPLTDFDWRVSLADIDVDGPFSAFDGYDRVITLVRGDGMALTIDGVRHVVAERYRPLPFSGASTTDCELLDGPIVDFNVMTRTGVVDASVDIVCLAGDETTVSLPASSDSQEVLLLVLEGSLQRPQPLGELDAILLRGEPETVVASEESATIAVVKLARTRTA